MQHTTTNRDWPWRCLPLMVPTAIVLIAGCSNILKQSNTHTATEAVTPPAQANTAAPAKDSPAGDTAESLRALYAQPSDQWPAFVVDDGVDTVELGIAPKPVYPADNPYTKEKAALGKQLFFDPRLSASNEMSCASCHDPDLGWADGKTVSFGTERLPLARNAPTALGSGHLSPLFWDGRADSLEALTAEVINNADELHGLGEDAAKNIAAVPEYRAAFAEVFGDDVTLDRITQAVATFVRTLNPGRSRFDLFLKGRHNALTDQELRGLHVYRTEANCMNCHHGPMFSDRKLHTTGLHLYGRRGEDLGAYNVTNNDDDRGAFRTPTLRNIEHTRPYMHHGLFDSLQVVVRAYDGGIKVGQPRGKQLSNPEFPAQSPLVHELNLTDGQIDDLIAFLEALSEPHRRIESPDLPPGLHGRE